MTLSALMRGPVVNSPATCSRILTISSGLVNITCDAPACQEISFHHFFHPTRGETVKQHIAIRTTVYLNKHLNTTINENARKSKSHLNTSCSTSGEYKNSTSVFQE